MIEQQGNAIKFYAFFVASKVGKTGLTVTIDVYRNDTEIVTAGSATEVGDGLYKYVLASGSVNAEGEYVAVFKTADTTVDQQHIPALWVIDKAGVDNLNATVSSRASQASLDTLDDYVDTEVAAIKAKTDQLAFTNANKVDAAVLAAGDFAQAAADKVWASTVRTLTSFGTLVADIWDRATSALTTVGSIGKLLVDNLNATVSSRASQASLDTLDDYVDTEVAAIKAKTDQLAFTTANRVDATVVDKTGFKLASDGLDTVAAPADVTNDANARSSFVKMIRAVFNRLYNENRQNATQRTVRNDAGTVVSTQTVSDDGTTQTIGKSA